MQVNDLVKVIDPASPYVNQAGIVISSSDKPKDPVNTVRLDAHDDPAKAVADGPVSLKDSQLQFLGR